MLSNQSRDSGYPLPTPRVGFCAQGALLRSKITARNAATASVIGPVVVFLGSAIDWSITVKKCIALTLAGSDPPSVFLSTVMIAQSSALLTACACAGLLQKLEGRLWHQVQRDWRVPRRRRRAPFFRSGDARSPHAPTVLLPALLGSAGMAPRLPFAPVTRRRHRVAAAARASCRRGAPAGAPRPDAHPHPRGAGVRDTPWGTCGRSTPRGRPRHGLWRRWLSDRGVDPPPLLVACWCPILPAHVALAAVQWRHGH